MGSGYPDDVSLFVYACTLIRDVQIPRQDEEEPHNNCWKPRRRVAGINATSTHTCTHM